MNYYEFNHNNNFGKQKKQLLKWRRIQDSIFSTIKLSNDEALSAYNYSHLIDNFMIREPEELATEYRVNRKWFLKKWFRTDTARGTKIINSAEAGILNEKVIDKYLKRKAAEYAYGQAIKHEYSEANYTSAVLLYNHLKKRYPASRYIKSYNSQLLNVINKQHQVINSKIIFEAGNGTNLKTFNDVLKLFKGKTVLIDMWGTWCGPCREEIQKNAEQLKDHFNGKNVVFLYIANSDMEKEYEWKKQINYFQIEGTHILANPQLTDDIMAKAKATGYPTYIIIKQNGTFKQTETKYPVNLQAMEKEIEAAIM
jgi:thiol-disulfide isomerase/thioredoxin